MKNRQKYWFSRNEPVDLGGGKGILIEENKTFTLSTLQDEAICYEIYDARGNGGGGVVLR